MVRKIVLKQKRRGPLIPRHSKKTLTAPGFHLRGFARTAARLRLTFDERSCLFVEELTFFSV